MSFGSPFAGGPSRRVWNASTVMSIGNCGRPGGGGGGLAFAGGLGFAVLASPPAAGGTTGGKPNALRKWFTIAVPNCAAPGSKETKESIYSI